MSKKHRRQKEEASERELLEAGMEAESFLEYSEEESPKKEKKAKVSKVPSPVDPAEFKLDHSGESLLRMRAEKGIEKVEKVIEERMPKEKNKRIKKILKIVLLIVLMVGSLAVVIPLVQFFTEEGTETATLGDLFKHMNVNYAVLAVVCTLLIVVLGGLRHAYITKITAGKFYPLKCTRIHLLGKFYDNVTPLATGGQPFEIYELNKLGIPGGTATAIPMIRYFIQMFTVTPVALFLFIFNNKVLSTGLDPAMATTISIFAYIGMAVFMIIPVFLILVTIMPRLGMRMAAWVLRIGAKFKIVKNYDKAIEKAAKMVAEFKVAMKYVTTNPVHIISLFVITFAETVMIYGIPFLLCIAFGDVTPTWELFLQTITLNCYAFFAVSFLPTPGNSGFAEGIFAMMFTGVKFVGKNPIVWVVLMWRFLTYYLYIVIGLCIILFDAIKSRIRKHRNKKPPEDLGGASEAEQPALENV